ncbi:MAG: hypothetical protein WA705_03165 [Candidatus Ozemobacteraceae bacterium]
MKKPDSQQLLCMEPITESWLQTGSVSADLLRKETPIPEAFRPAASAFQSLPSLDLERTSTMLSPDRELFGIVQRRSDSGPEPQALLVDIWRTRTLKKVYAFTFLAPVPVPEPDPDPAPASASATDSAPGPKPGPDSTPDSGSFSKPSHAVNSASPFGSSSVLGSSSARDPGSAVAYTRNPDFPCRWDIFSLCLLDSHHLALGSTTGQLVVISLDDGNVVLAETVGPSVRAIGSDGIRLAVSIFGEEIESQQKSDREFVGVKIFNVACIYKEKRLHDDFFIPKTGFSSIPTHFQFSPDATELLCLERSSSGLGSCAEVITLPDRRVRKLNETFFGQSISDLSDQGTYLLGELLRFSLRGPHHQEIMSIPYPEDQGHLRMSPSLSPDGTQVLLLGKGQIFEVKGATSTLRLQQLGRILGIWYVANGLAIAMIRQPEAYDLALVDTIAWKTLQTLSQPGRFERPQPRALAFSRGGQLLVGDRTGAVQLFRKGLVEAQVAEGGWGAIEEVVPRGQETLFTILTSTGYAIHFHSDEKKFSRSYCTDTGKPLVPDFGSPNIIIPVDEEKRGSFLIRKTVGVAFSKGKAIEAEVEPGKADAEPRTWCIGKPPSAGAPTSPIAPAAGIAPNGETRRPDDNLQDQEDVRKVAKENLTEQWEVFTIPMPVRVVGVVGMNGATAVTSVTSVTSPEHPPAAAPRNWFVAFLLESGELRIYDPEKFASEVLPDGKRTLVAVPDPGVIDLGFIGLPRGVCRLTNRRLAIWTDDRIWIIAFDSEFRLIDSFWKPIPKVRGIRHDPVRNRLAVVFPDYIGFFDAGLEERYRLYLLSNGGRFVHVLHPEKAKGAAGAELGCEKRGARDAAHQDFFWSDTDVMPLLEVVDTSGKVINDPEVRRSFLEDRRSEFLVQEATEDFDRFRSHLCPTENHRLGELLLLEE